jgi:AraC-like DNA-binding protein
MPYVALVTDGAYFESSVDGVYWCEPGSIILHPPLHLHANRFPRGPVRVWNFPFSPSSLGAARCRSTVLRVPCGARAGLSQVHHAEHLFELLPECEPVPAEPSPGLAGAVAALMHRSPTASVGNMARELGVSREHLSRAFSAHFGMSPVCFRGELRLARTLALLGSRHSSLTQVALAAGFADHAHMARAISAAARMPALAVRRWLAC